MATKWKVLSTGKEKNSDCITEVLYECKISTKLGYAKKLGHIEFSIEEEVDPNYIPFEDLTEKVVLGWVKDNLGKEGVKAIEEKVKQKYDKKIAYTEVEQGVPWK